MKKIILIFLTVLILVSFALPICAAEGNYSVDLDKTTVTDDLSKVYKDLSTYYIDSLDTEIYLITVAESGVTSKGLTDDYALYFYFHNPSLKEVSPSDYNKIQLACAWDVDGNPVNYKKYTLELLSVSSDMRFIKCKLSAPTDAVYMTGNARVYDISGVELVGIITDSFSSEDYSVNRRYEFSGYEGNLLCKISDLLTITLDVHQTSYLSGDSGKEISHDVKGSFSNQINSVYFSIPNSIIKNYGDLYAVDYEFYHYRTAPILIVDNESDYNFLSNHIGNKLDFNIYNYYYYSGGFSSGVEYYYYDTFIGKLNDNEIHFGGGKYHYYKDDCTYDYYSSLFFVDDIDDRENILVSSEELLQYFEKYDASSFNGEITTVGSKKYSADLWDLEKSVGYNRFYRTIDESFSLDSYKDSKNNNFFKHLFYGQWHYAFDIDSYDNSLVNVPFIEEVKSTSFLLTDDLTSEKLYISADDVDDLRDYVADSADDDKRTYLLRYAYSDDYYSAYLESSSLENDVLMVQENVYLDFDIITLSFTDEDVISVIPVVANPTDGFTGIENTTPKFELFSENDWSWLKILLGVVLGVLALFVVFNLVITVNRNKSRSSKDRSTSWRPKRNGNKQTGKRFKRRR